MLVREGEALLRFSLLLVRDFSRDGKHFVGCSCSQGLLLSEPHSRGSKIRVGTCAFDRLPLDLLLGYFDCGVIFFECGLVLRVVVRPTRGIAASFREIALCGVMPCAPPRSASSPQNVFQKFLEKNWKAELRGARKIHPRASEQRVEERRGKKCNLAISATSCGRELLENTALPHYALGRRTSARGSHSKAHVSSSESRDLLAE